MLRPPLSGSFAAKDKRSIAGEHKFRRYNRPVRQWLSLGRDTATDTIHRVLMDTARSTDTISIVTPALFASCAPIIIQYLLYWSSIDHRYHY